MAKIFIGEVAKSAGVNFETVLFYERRELTAEPQRSENSNYREYPSEVVTRIRFIKLAQNLGFTLKEIQELLDLRSSPHTTCAELKARVDEKISTVEAKIKDLRRIKNVLTKLSRECAGGRIPASECPILDAMEGGKNVARTISPIYRT